MQVKVDTSRVARLADAFGASIKQMRRAEVRALNKTLRWVVKNITREIGQTAKLPAKLIKQRVRAFKATARHRSGRVWAGLDPIRAHRLGKSRQLKRGGVRVGRHKFEKAFVHNASGGKVVIFQRTGEAKRKMQKGRYAGKGIKREPVRRAELEIDSIDTRAILEEWFGKAQGQFMEVFKQELKYEVFVKANA